MDESGFHDKALGNHLIAPIQLPGLGLFQGELMKHVSHICQQQKALDCRLDAFSPRYVALKTPQNLTLSCSRWKTGRKLTIKVSVTNASH